MHIDYAIEIAASPGGGQDRAAVFTLPDDSLVVALADGAGGTGGGAAAAQSVIDAVGELARDDRHVGWVEVLTALDHDPSRLGHGQTTAVVLRIDASGIVGASVGDSGAWILSTGQNIVDLTALQHRKPLLGDNAIVTPCDSGPPGHSTLLVASDGLLKYVPRSDIARIATGPDLRSAAASLVDRARLPSGGLQDDIAVVLVRLGPRLE